jgi:hypothetical protein
MKKRRVQRFTAMMLLICLVAGPASIASAQPNSAAPSLADQEKEGCIRNLKTLYTAIEAFQRDRKALPNWLSDLVPQYLPDTNALICPVCRRTGQTEKPPLADPKLPCSYLFEFCPVPLVLAGPNAPTPTRQEWKRRQMGLVGSIVPVVRCRHHTPVLNLAFDGNIYESPGSWELLVTNRVAAADLAPDRMFAAELGRATNAPARPRTARRFPHRDPQAGPELLDLTAYYNAGLNQSWHGNASNTLAALPKGLQTFAAVEFDVRGIVQLRSRARISTNFPASINGIPVHQKCERLHFLHAAGFGTPGDEGKLIGGYVVHFATNQMSLEIPIRYGREVRNWHTQAGEPAAPEGLKEAWRGQNPVSKRAGHAIRLFLTTWTNVAPDLEIASIDYVSNMEVPAPFLIAITAAARNEAVAAKAPTPAAVTPEAERAFLKRSATQQARALDGSVLILLVIAVLVIGGLLVVFVWVVAKRSRRARTRAQRLLPPAVEGRAGILSSYTVVAETQSGTGPLVPTPRAAPKPPPVIHIDAPGATHTHAEILRLRAETADQGVRDAAPSSLVADFSLWLKQKLLRRLIADRTDLLAAQQVAASKAMTMEERLARVERHLQQQNDGYQRRLEELMQALLAAKEENRDLIRAQIRQVKAEMEAARARLLAQANEDSRQ